MMTSSEGIIKIVNINSINISSIYILSLQIHTLDITHHCTEKLGETKNKRSKYWEQTKNQILKHNR